MSINQNEMQILKQLLFKQQTSPNIEIHNIDGGTSMQQGFDNLKSLGFIEEHDRGTYRLTNLGKKFAQDLDADHKIPTMNRRPKISVLAAAITPTHVLIVRRLKSPYYGYLGFVTGKPKIGELFVDTAKREFQEETGLTAKKAMFCFSIHELNFNKDGELLEDKLFMGFLMEEVSGTILATDEAESLWVTHQQFENLDKKFYDMDDLFDWFLKPPTNGFIEKTYISEGF